MQSVKSEIANAQRPNPPTEFGEALGEWHDFVDYFARQTANAGEQDQAMTKRLAEREAQSAAETRAAHKPGTCEMCGWPRGQRGFVRFPFPVGHALFGKAVKCPRCNP